MSSLAMNAELNMPVEDQLAGSIQGGFRQPVESAGRVFRLLLNAMSSPCSEMIVTESVAAPKPLCLSAYAIALTLLDHSTRLMLTPELAQADVLPTLKFHCQSPMVDDARQADFIFCSERNRPALSALNAGTEKYPDQSTTLVIQCDSFSDGPLWKASGPGIETEKSRRCSAFTPQLLEELSEQYLMYREQSLGIDLIFCCENRFFCIPRSSRIVEEV